MDWVSFTIPAVKNIEMPEICIISSIMIEYQETIKASHGGDLQFVVIDAENQPLTDNIHHVYEDYLRHRWCYRDLIEHDNYTHVYIRDCNLNSKQICEILNVHNHTVIYGNTDIMLDVDYILMNMPPRSNLTFTISVILSLPYEYIHQHYHKAGFMIEIKPNGITISRKRQ